MTTPAQEAIAIVGKMRASAEAAVTKSLQLLEADTGCRVTLVDVERDFSSEGRGQIVRAKLHVGLS